MNTARVVLISVGLLGQTTFIISSRASPKNFKYFIANIPLTPLNNATTKGREAQGNLRGVKNSIVHRRQHRTSSPASPIVASIAHRTSSPASPIVASIVHRRQHHPRPFLFSSMKNRAGGARTPSFRFWRPILYQLSYCPNI